jgi:hypothetical protein
VLANLAMNARLRAKIVRDGGLDLILAALHAHSSAVDGGDAGSGVRKQAWRERMDRGSGERESGVRERESGVREREREKSVCEKRGEGGASIV